MTFKDWCKEKPYWLKGIILGVIFSFLTGIIIPLIVVLFFFRGFGGDYLLRDYFINFLRDPIYFIFNNDPFSFAIFSFPLHMLLNLSFYVIVSGLLGFVYGKIKSKK